MVSLYYQLKCAAIVASIYQEAQALQGAAEDARQERVVRKNNLMIMDNLESSIWEGGIPRALTFKNAVLSRSRGIDQRIIGLVGQLNRRKDGLSLSNAPPSTRG